MNELEIKLFRMINDLAGQSPTIDLIMSWLSDSRLWITVGAVLLVLSWRIKNPALLSVLVTALIALGIADLVSFEIIKPLVGRERPCWLLEGVRLAQGKCGGSYGFTSNHAANAFAVWMVVARNYGIRSWQGQLTLTLATLVSVSRVFLGVHFVGDVVGGAILGSAVAASLCAFGLPKFSIALSQKILGSSS